jgi:ArsR family transcriptional regulator, virulence genes transcriptional regulator
VSARARSAVEIDAEAMRRNAGAAARLLKTLANDQRLRVLCLLIGGELSVGQINDRIDLSQSALSQHLAKLREEGLVTTRREAQTIYYSLVGGPVQAIIQALHDIYCRPPTRRNPSPRGRSAERPRS